MAQATLTPEQLATAASYAAKWIAIGLAVTPEGGTDRARAFKAQCAMTKYIHNKPREFVHLDLIPPTKDDPADTVHVRWVNREGTPRSKFYREVGHTEHVPSNWLGQDAKKVYVVTGTFDRLITAVRCWTNQVDLSFHWLAGQYSVATSCYAHFVLDVFALPVADDIKEKLVVVDEYALATGNAFCYENVVFVSDHPVGHIREADKSLTPAWSDAHAKRLGMRKEEDGTWSK